MKTILITSILTVFSASALALDGGFFAGVQGGTGKFKYTDTPGSTNTVGIMAGYMFNPRLGLEIGYKSLGSTTSNLVQNADLKADATYLNVLLPLPLSESFSVSIHAGIASVKTTGHRLAPALATVSGTKTGFTGGFGAQYNFTKNIGVRVGYDGYRSEVSSGGVVTGTAVSDLSMGAVWTF